MSDYFHYNEPLSNSDTGQGLIGYFLRVIDATTGAVVPIYADENSTPISSVSGKDNLAQSDADSMVSFYVTPANAYNLDLYAPDGETFLKRYPNVGMASTVGPQGPQGVPGAAGNVDPDLASLKAALTTDVARIYDHAVFKWTAGDYTGQADDTNIIQSDNAALTVGAWVRQLAANIQASDGNTVQAFLNKIAANAPTVFKASTQPAQGEGSLWRAGPYAYKEAAADATDHHITNAAGVKFYVQPINGALAAEAFGVVADDGTIDNADALEAWVSASVAGRYRLAWPTASGTIYSSRPLRFKGDATYYSMLTGIFSDAPGPGVIFTRKQAGASKFARPARAGVSVPAGQGCLSRWGKPYINNTASAITLTDKTNASIEAAGLTAVIQEVIDEAFLVIHGSNYDFRGLRFEQCQIGWLMIADPSSAAQSNTSFNTVLSFRYRNCSIGGFMCADNGAHYNQVERHHGTQCQFGLVLGGSRLETHNTNRNNFSFNRMSRCHVGYANLSGDTNGFIRCHTEGGAAAPSSNPYTSPDGLPDGRSSWAWINTGLKQGHISCVDEGSTNLVYSEDGETEYYNCTLGFDTSAADSLFTVVPCTVMTKNIVWMSSGLFSMLPNVKTSVFGTRTTGPFFAGPLRVDGPIQQSLNYGDGTTTNKVGAVKSLVDAGTLNSGGSYALALWNNTQSGDDRRQDTAAYFEITVLGDGVAGNYAHVTTAKVVARRSSSGSLGRYFLLGTSGGRATGTNVGDGTELFGVALSDVGGVLTATITPQSGRNFEKVLVLIEARYARP